MTNPSCTGGESRARAKRARYLTVPIRNSVHVESSLPAERSARFAELLCQIDAELEWSLLGRAYCHEGGEDSSTRPRSRRCGTRPAAGVGSRRGARRQRRARGLERVRRRGRLRARPDPRRTHPPRARDRRLHAARARARGARARSPSRCSAYGRSAPELPHGGVRPLGRAALRPRLARERADRPRPLPRAARRALRTTRLGARDGARQPDRGARPRALSRPEAPAYSRAARAVHHDRGGARDRGAALPELGLAAEAPERARLARRCRAPPVVARSRRPRRRSTRGRNARTRIPPGSGRPASHATPPRNGAPAWGICRTEERAQLPSQGS